MKKIYENVQTTHLWHMNEWVCYTLFAHMVRLKLSSNVHVSVCAQQNRAWARESNKKTKCNN